MTNTAIRADLAVQPTSGRRRAAERSIVMLGVLAAIAALVVGRDVLVPVAISIVIATVLRPPVRRLQRLRLPAPAAAAIVVLVLVGLVIGLGVALERPVRAMAAQAPSSIGVARRKVDALATRVRGMIGQGASPRSPGGGAAAQSAQTEQSAQPAGSSSTPLSAPSSSIGHAFGITSSLLAEIVEEVLLVFFLLAAGNAWMDKLRRIAQSPSGERLWPSIAGEMHDVVARYLVVTLLINLVQAIVIGLALWAVGTPTPLLWGALTFVAEFIPYLGGAVMIGLLLVTGLAGNQDLGHALLAPAIYLVVTTLQNNLVSPVAYGRGLRLNPAMILVAVMVWWALWGVAGAFLAVPILASLRVLGSRVPSLEPLAVLLEE